MTKEEVDIMIMKIYDYDNRATEVELPNDKQIEGIFVNIISGDETGFVCFTDASCIRFDASNCRLFGYDDGGYIIRGDNIQKWLDWEPNDDDYTYSYSRQRAFNKYD